MTGKLHPADVAIELLELAFNGIPVLDTVPYNKPHVNWSLISANVPNMLQILPFRLER